jgi:hypothetical protein
MMPTASTLVVAVVSHVSPVGPSSFSQEDLFGRCSTRADPDHHPDEAYRLVDVNAAYESGSATRAMN